MTKLSLCAIVKNEAATLPQCLNSVKNLVGEMVVLDTGSTDATVKLAEELGAKVYHYQWHDDFAAARNQALEYVTGEWVLVLDADEVLVAEVIPHIQQAIQGENNLVVNLLRHEIGAASSPYSQVSRLFRNHPQVKFSRPYHALIDDTVAQLLKQEPHWHIVSLPQIAIEHYGYQPEAMASKDKTKRAQKAMEAYWREHPQDAYVCSKLGALYLQLGQAKEGIKLLKQGLKSNQADGPLLFELHYHLANALVKAEKVEAAVKHYQKAIAQPILEKLKLGAYHNLASLCQSLGDFQNAIKIYETTLKIDPNFALAYYNLGLTYKAMGRSFQAINAYQQAIKINPEYPWTYQNLGVLLLKIGQIEESAAAFKQAIALHQKQNPSEAARLKEELQGMGITIT
jgi:tetratricopeptide (TPR) repeat protein